MAELIVKLKLGFAMRPAIRILGDDAPSPGMFWVKEV